MFFQLIKLVLWPRRGGEPRVVTFEPGVVNVISGASKTGKSAVIPIIDYCLGAGKCAIPVGVIREECSWFGVLVETIEGQKLIARREPGDQQSTGDMFVVEGEVVVVPEKIEQKNSSAETVRAMLDRLAGLSSLEFEPGSANGFKSRVSFRDLAAFMFQPQNIIANPDVLFFKADTTEHREKLKTIFPYVLGAVTPRILALRQELDQIERQLRRKESELKSLRSATDRWMAEGRTWMQRAIDLGLAPVQDPPAQWSDLLDKLRAVLSESPNSPPSMSGIDSTLDRLGHLRGLARDVAADLSDHRQRLNELRRLKESSESYGEAMLLQRDRLSISSWMRTRVGASADPLAVSGEDFSERIQTLCNVLEGAETQLRSHPFMSDTLDAELLRQRSKTEEVLVQLSAIKGEIAAYEQVSEENQKAASRYNAAERFLGSLEQAIVVYDESDSSAPLVSEIDDLRRKADSISREISEKSIRERLDSSLNAIQNLTSRIVPKLDAEWPDAPVRLSTSELTVQVSREKRRDYLWEIGSGANWLAYHVAITLALQLFFLKRDHHPAPAILIYDQPSQVYFPRRTAKQDADQEDVTWGNQDVQAVRKVFEVLARAIEVSKGRLQIIVLDHAHSDVWGDLPYVQLREEWRGNVKLVPVDWLVRSDGSLDSI